MGSLSYLVQMTDAGSVPCPTTIHKTKASKSEYLGAFFLMRQGFAGNPLEIHQIHSL
jgi:hypothetical protein